MIKEGFIMDHTEQNLNMIEDYFRSSCKSPDTPFRLGVEIEHFLMDKTSHHSVKFYGERGVEALLVKLLPSFNEPHYQDGHLVGLDCGAYNISLEPSCQFEISIMPETDLAEIERLYEQFRRLVDPVLDDFHLELLNYGYNPYEKNEEMELIPKKRYAFMDRYFTEIGTNARHMMRSTASTQVSIDFYSEEDCIRKFKSVYILGPVFALLADNCPVYDGKPNTIHIRRQKIWRDVDAKRVNVFDYMDFDHFGFRDYAGFIYNTPLIVLEDETGTSYTTRTAREIYADRPLSNKDILHLLSMVFPMARLKNYVEIRCADSMPIKKSLQFTALIKGLYIHPERLYNLISELKITSARDTITAEDAVMENGYDAVVYGRRVSDLLDELFEIAKDNLGQDERRYLC